MKQFAIAIAVVAAVMLPAAASASTPTLDLSPLDHSQCGGGTLVVDVTQDVINDADSGVAGNAWAFDDYQRQIRVWQTGPDTYCAILRYDGEFVTNAGPSPNNTGTLAAGVQGELAGGYRTTHFTGTFAPTAPTSGDLGTFDYACDTSFNCPGRVSWPSLYFSSTSGFDLEWWGWIYTTDANGTWVNAISGNLGDITGSPPPEDLAAGDGG
jgi:hypothetical protein